MEIEKQDEYGEIIEEKEKPQESKVFEEKNIVDVLKEIKPEKESNKLENLKRIQTDIIKCLSLRA